jgi:hypothetical protein
VGPKIAPLLCAVASCTLLASCFGGGGDSPTPTPTPSPSPSPSPTPTPTPTPTAVDFDFAKAFTATATNTAYIFAYFTPNSGGAEVWSDGNTRSGTSKITYAVSPESAAFVWPDNSSLTPFGAADLQTGTPTLRSYRKGIDGLVMELPFQHVLRVTYETTVDFVRETVPGKLRSSRVALFFNSVTTTAAITTDLAYTGTAKVAGGKSGTTPANVFSSPATTLTVAASDKKITGTITIVENVNGTPTVRAALPISAAIGAGGGFSGNTEDTANAFKGSFVGSLAGPSREEAVLIFTVSHTDGRKFVGSFIGS